MCFFCGQGRCALFLGYCESFFPFESSKECRELALIHTSQSFIAKYSSTTQRREGSGGFEKILDLKEKLKRYLAQIYSKSQNLKDTINVESNSAFSG